MTQPAFFVVNPCGNAESGVYNRPVLPQPHPQPGSQAVVTTPAQHSFSGHDTFPFRYAWLKKGVDAVTSDPMVFGRDEAITVLGVGKNMVRAIRHWCLAAGLVQETPESRGTSLQVTKLGKRLFADRGFDPYLEDPATLWLLHWQIASNRARSTTWFWAFSHFHEPEFSREAFLQALLRWVPLLGGKAVAEISVRRDVDCFFRTYLPSKNLRSKVLEESLDCPFVELSLLRSAPAGQTLSFVLGEKDTLPDGVLFYATLQYWEQFAGKGNALSLYDLCRQPGSPGQLFKLDDDSLAARYERFENTTEGAIVYDETAGLKQLYRRRLVPPSLLLSKAYGKTASFGGLFA